MICLFLWRSSTFFRTIHKKNVIPGFFHIICMEPILQVCFLMYFYYILVTEVILLYDTNIITILQGSKFFYTGLQYSFFVPHLSTLFSHNFFVFFLFGIFLNNIWGNTFFIRKQYLITMFFPLHEHFVHFQISGALVVQKFGIWIFFKGMRLTQNMYKMCNMSNLCGRETMEQFCVSVRQLFLQNVRWKSVKYQYVFGGNLLFCNGQLVVTQLFNVCQMKF
eukprot:TRINITY_DN2352_c0_g1_i5.p1 TRINITY_DN2352_c0_g1~~TRINITY_DN2352_c0_g1_i5.p1  ORF type:complete len:221 (-),score=-11.28 TRINITY_DN2352_c0_g1_i5:113-775(-)